jgi:hypothetical protein
MTHLFQSWDFGKKEPAGNRTTITCGRTKIEIYDRSICGSVFLFILLGFDLGTPKFQDNRVCRFYFFGNYLLATDRCY